MSDPARPVVTGYPARPIYPYPPPPHYYYPNPQIQTQTQTQQPTSFLRRIFSILIATTILFLLITLIAYLILKPQLPIFIVTSATISNFTITNSSLLSFTSRINLNSRNTNKKLALKFENVEGGFFYDWYVLAETNMEPFELGKGKEGELVAGFAAAGGFVERGIVGRIEREKGRGGGNVSVVEFGFRLVCNVGFQTKGWRTRRFVRAFCPVVVEFDGADGRLSGGSSKCNVVIG